VSEDLRREVEFYRSVLERSPDAFLVVDVDGVIHLASRAHYPRDGCAA
jgi:PAS domain S-box-containing protein